MFRLVNKEHITLTLHKTQYNSGLTESQAKKPLNDMININLANQGQFISRNLSKQWRYAVQVKPHEIHNYKYMNWNPHVFLMWWNLSCLTTCLRGSICVNQHLISSSEQSKECHDTRNNHTALLLAGYLVNICMWLFLLPLQLWQVTKSLKHSCVIVP